RGVVSSQQEGKMEGVVVSARREGGNVTVSVVTDKDGRYSFPRTHLQPGSYRLTTRAVSYDCVDSGAVTVETGKTITADLALQKTKDLANQLSSMEWIMSMNGTPEEKDKMIHTSLSCNYCHTLQRIAKSKHTAEEFMPLIHRMIKYYADGSAMSN